MLLWVGSVLTGMQQPQHLQALGDLIQGLSESFFKTHGSYLISSLTLGFYFPSSHQAQTTCWDHPKMTELYQTLGKEIVIKPFEQHLPFCSVGAM